MTAGRRGAFRAGRSPAIVAFLLLLASCRSAPVPQRAAVPEVPSGRVVRAEVLNGCGVPGVADLVASRLRAAHVVVERTGNARELGYTRDLVISRTEDPAPAALVARCLDDPVRLVQRNETADVDVTVIVGRPR